MRKISFLLLLFISSLAAQAQVLDDATYSPRKSRKSRLRTVDTSYIRLFPNTYTIRTYVGEKFATFSLEDRMRGHDLDYRPNAVLALGLGFNYRGLGLSLSTRTPFHDPKESLYGKTQRFDFQLHRYRRKLAIDLYLQRYKGYHLNDKAQAPLYVGQGTEDSPEFPYFPEMRSLKLGVTALYVFNGNRFSMRSAVNQQEWQLKSSGSPMIGAALFYHQLSNGGDGLIPTGFPDPMMFGGYNPTKIHSYSLTFQGGYGYTYVYRKNWFATLAADVGFGPGFVRMEGKSLVDPTFTREDRSGLDIQGRANLRASLGYNNQNWTFGLFGIATGDRYTLPKFPGETKSGQVGSTQGIVRLVAARRFPMKAKKPLTEKIREKVLDW